MDREFLWGVPCPVGSQDWGKSEQADLLSFIKGSIQDGNLSPSEYLRDLIMRVTRHYVQQLPKLPQLEWSTQLIDILRELLVQGADPTWIPQGLHESALFAFIPEVFRILGQIEKPLSLELEKLLPFFLTMKCISHRESQGTLLQSLLYYPLFNCIGGNSDLCKKFKETLSIIASEYNIDSVDFYGRTPLHLFSIELFECDIKTLSNLLFIFDILKSPKSLNMKDRKEKTPLHHFTIGLFKCDTETFPKLLSIFGSLKTPDNVNMKDCDGRTPLHLLATGLSKCDIKTLPHLKSLFELLKTPENVNMKDNEGRTPLNILTIELSKCYINTLPHIFPIFNMVKTPDNVNMKDCDGRTPLHLLATGLSKYDIETLEHLLPLLELLRTPENVDMIDNDGGTLLHLLAKGLLEETDETSQPMPFLFELFLTEKNVNCKDIYSVTPYSWILVVKGKWKDDASKQKMISEIDNKFKKEKADDKMAKSAETIVILRWMEKEFGEHESKWSEKRLQRLLGCMKSVANWEHHKYQFYLNECAIRNLWYMKNTRWIAIVMEIMGVILKNKTTAQDIWDALMAYYVAINNRHCSLHIMELLSICAEAGAQPTEEQVHHIRKWVKVFTKNGEWAEPYLKILVSSNKEKVLLCKYDLSFLGEFYQVSPNLVKLGKDLVHLVYKTWDECVESGQLINCFLFITNEQKVKNDEYIKASTCVNWMGRSPLHLAVIFLNIDSLVLLSHGVIEKYIEARDVHGCTPLHLAYLHQNEHAVKFLMHYVKDENVTDHFGLTPVDSSIEDAIKKKYNEDCGKLLKANKEVMELLKPMILMPVDQANDLCKEIKILFERLIKETKFPEAKIQIAGSMRERMKSGILDEADIQIQLNKETLKSLNVVKELPSDLRDALPIISWEDIHLRPIDVSGPWKLIWEGSGRGMHISLDVVLILIGDEKNENSNYEESIQWQQKIIQGAPPHKRMEFLTLEPWNEDILKILRATMFESEWDIIDSLPTPCRLAISITKALVQVSIQVYM